MHKIVQPESVWGTLRWVLQELGAPSVSHTVLQSGELWQRGNINQGSNQHGCLYPKPAA